MIFHLTIFENHVRDFSEGEARCGDANADSGGMQSLCEDEYKILRHILCNMETTQNSFGHMQSFFIMLAFAIFSHPGVLIFSLVDRRE